MIFVVEIIAIAIKGIDNDMSSFQRYFEWDLLTPTSTPFIQNAVIVAIDAHTNTILMVKEASNGKYGFPGGRVERSKDRTIFDAAKREFEEETGFRFFKIDSISEIQCFIWDSETAFFVFRVYNHNNIFKPGGTPPGLASDGEIVYIKAEKPSVILSKEFPIRPDGFDSTVTLLRGVLQMEE